MARRPLYFIQVDIYEPEGAGWDYPIVQHRFVGKTRAEAKRYHDAHLKSDRFLRQCEKRGRFDDRVTCKAIVTKGRVR